MRYNELYEEASDVFYHVTTKRRLKSILAGGIAPGHNRRWKNRAHVVIGSRDHVYMISDFTAAVRWAAHMSWEFSKNMNLDNFVILAIRPPKTMEPDPNLQGQLDYAGK